MKSKNNILIKVLKSLICPFIVYAFFAIVSGGRFGSLESLYIVLQQAIIPATISWGIAFNLTVGSFDFSVGSIVLLTSIIAAKFENAYGFLPMIIACLVFGTLLGCLNGTIFTVCRIPSIVVTIGMLLAYESTGILVSGSIGLVIDSSHMILGQMPWLLIVGIIACAIAYVLFYHTKFGCAVQAIGSEPLIAQNIGISFRKTKFMSFGVVGFFAGIASIVKLGYGGNAWPMYGMSSMSTVFQAMMAFHIGRYISRTSGINLPVCVFLGAFTMTMVSTGMIAIGVPGSFQNAVIGAFLLVFIILSENGTKFSFKKLMPRKA